MDKLVRIYYSAVAHRYTLQAGLCWLCDNQFGTRSHEAAISTSNTSDTDSLPGDFWVKPKQAGEGGKEGKEPSAQLRNQEEVLR